MRDPLRTLLFSTALGLWLAGEPVAFATSLYQCNTTSEGMIYTDNPAQLDGCVPITPSGEVSSLASTSAGYSSGEQPVNSTAVMHAPPAPPEPMPIAPGHGAGSPMPHAMPSTAPHEREASDRPCPVGLIPLNPFNMPPCQSEEVTIPTPMPMRAAPGMMPPPHP